MVGVHYCGTAIILLVCLIDNPGYGEFYSLDKDKYSKYAIWKWHTAKQIPAASPSQEN